MEHGDERGYRDVATRRKSKVTLVIAMKTKILFALLAALCGFGFWSATDWPRHRTYGIISQGKFVEGVDWGSDFFFCFVCGSALFALSGYLLRLAYLDGMRRRPR